MRFLKDLFSAKEKNLLDASRIGQEDIVKLFLKDRPDINWQNRDGITPLMAAVISNHVNIAKILLEAGANVKIQDTKGVPALGYAIFSEHQEMIDLLLGHGAKHEDVGHLFSDAASENNDEVDDIVDLYTTYMGRVPEILSPEFSIYLKNLEQPVFGKAASIGYVIRYMEWDTNRDKANSIMSITKDTEIEGILKDSSESKSELIADYLDRHDYIGLGEPVSQFALQDFQKTKSFFNWIMNEFSQDMSDFSESENVFDGIQELFYRNAAYGYNLRVAEEIILYHKNM